MSEQAQLIALCRRLGADEAQAAVMAAQLLKRADQLAGERGWTRVQAMEHLLRLVVNGRSGATAPGFEGRSQSPTE